MAQAAAAAPPAATGFRSMADALAALRATKATKAAKAANAANAPRQPEAAPAAAAAPSPTDGAEPAAAPAQDVDSKANAEATTNATRQAEPAPQTAATTATPAPAHKPAVAKEDIDRCSGLVVGYAPAYTTAPKVRRLFTLHFQPDLITCDRKRRTSKLDVELATSSAKLVKLRDLVSFARTIPADVKAVPDWAVGGALAEKSSATTYEPLLPFQSGVA